MRSKHLFSKTDHIENNRYFHLNNLIPRRFLKCSQISRKALILWRSVLGVTRSSSHHRCSYVRANYLASLLDFLDNACSGSVRSTLLRESSNQIAGIARYLYLMKSNVFIDGTLIKTEFAYKIKDEPIKSRANLVIKYFGSSYILR